MTLPPEITFRSARSIEGDDEDDYLIGFHLQYQIQKTIVNVVILSKVSPNASEKALENTLIDKLDEAGAVAEEEDNSEDVDVFQRLDDVSDEIQDWAEKECRSELLEIAKTVIKSGEIPPMTLHEFLHPDIVNLQLKTVNGNMSVIRYKDESPPWPTNLELGHPLGAKVELPESKEFPTYLSYDVKIVKQLAVPKVFVDEQLLRCKLNICSSSTKREHDIYLKIAAAGADKFRTPSFKGYVKEKSGGKVIGLLLKDLETKFSTLEAAMGDPMFASSDDEHILPSHERRRKWASQIEDTVQQLHSNEIVWGDVKPANVLIDIDDNAWVLDFGGGWTQPWKTAKDANTKHGDLKALKMIIQYLESGESPVMPFEAYKNDSKGNSHKDDERQQAFKPYLGTDVGQDSIGKRKRGAVDSGENLQGDTKYRTKS